MSELIEIVNTVAKTTGYLVLGTAAFLFLGLVLAHFERFGRDLEIGNGATSTDPSTENQRRWANQIAEQMGVAHDAYR